MYPYGETMALWKGCRSRNLQSGLNYQLERDRNKFIEFNECRNYSIIHVVKEIMATIQSEGEIVESVAIQEVVGMSDRESLVVTSHREHRSRLPKLHLLRTLSHDNYSLDLFNIYSRSLKFCTWSNLGFYPYQCKKQY